MADRLGMNDCDGRSLGKALAGLLAAFALAACTTTVPAKPPAPQEPPPAIPAPLPRVSEMPLAPPGSLMPTPGMAGMMPSGLPGDAVKVGLLLPLSGENAALGTGLLQAAQMALFDTGSDRFALLPRDTKGTPAGATEATRQLAAEGVRLILGPIFSAEVEAAKAARSTSGSASPPFPGQAPFPGMGPGAGPGAGPRAGGQPAAPGSPGGVPMLAFTNDTQRAGNGTWIMGFAPSDQVQRVVSYAKARGAQRFAVLAPRSPYGDAVTRAMQDTLRHLGAPPAREERYGNSDPEVTTAVGRLLGGGQPGSAMPGTGAGFGAPMSGAYDAVLIAEGGTRLRRVAALLAGAGFDSRRTRLLGTLLWDDPTLVRDPALQGGWFAAPSPTARADFEHRYEDLFRAQPARLTTLAYDATALAAVLSQSPQTASLDITALTNPGGFTGMDGIFRLRADGMVERGLAVMELTPEGARMVDVSPAGFDPLAF